MINALSIEGITREEIERMIQEADIDGNGTLCPLCLLLPYLYYLYYLYYLDLLLTQIQVDSLHTSLLLLFY